MSGGEEKTEEIAKTRINWFAVAGFGFGIASVPLCMMIAIPATGIILSIVGLVKAKRYRPWGRALAFIGLFASAICLLVAIIAGK